MGSLAKFASPFTEVAVKPPRFFSQRVLAEWIALKALEDWTPSSGHAENALLREVVEGPVFNVDIVDAYADCAVQIKRNAEREALFERKGKDAYFYFQPADTLDKEDVDAMIAAVRARHALPDKIADHENLDMLCDLLDVSGLERDFFNLSLWISSGWSSEAHQILINKVTAIERFKTREALLALILGCKAEDITKLMKGDLRNAGVIVTRAEDNFLVLARDLMGLFRQHNLSTTMIEDTLFPSTVNTDLDVRDYPHVADDVTRTMAIINRNLETKRPGTNLMFYGPPGTGKTELVLAMAKKQGWNLRVIGDIGAGDAEEKSRSARIASLKLAQKILASDPKAVLLFDEMEDLFKTDNNASFSKAFINRTIETSPIPVIWTTNSLMALEHSVLRRMVYSIHMDNPPAETRKIVWKRYARSIGLRLSDAGLTKLSERFVISPAIIRNAVNNAFAVVGTTKSAKAEKEVQEIVENMHKLINLGESPKYEESDRTSNPYDLTCVNSDVDIVQLTKDVMAARPNWALCLYGPPGTGKSEFGRYLADQLGKKVLFKRASDLQSMWLGEAEKNIAKAFAEAKRDGKVLLIDEGDTFLRNRESAKQSWEVSQVNEMLSQMERHSEPFILTTNLMADLDAAAMRRFTFKLKFDFLTTDQARALFKSYFGCEAPSALNRNTMLAPGDFANVKKQADIRRITDADVLYAMLQSETDLKPGATKNSIGFSL